MQLLKPTKKYAESWWQAIQEFEAEDIGGFWNIPDKPTNIDEYIQRTKDHSQGKNMPDWFVPGTTYWLIDNDKFVGHVNIRHELNDKLKKEGGNIGYAIRPTERQKGYGSKILELAIQKAKKIGLQKVLITCNDENIASAKIIEKNGGKLQDKNIVDEKLVRRYWLNVGR
ncbi:GNAT family N-acetyltransferase [Candidatus Peregrinibacteria bacterium]|nr:MAG: GNAT family N-acetyltransferase [Candidatus Peregrinibacteria bacterium]